METDETLAHLSKGSIATGLKVLRRCLGEYRQRIILLSVIGIISALGNGVVPYLAGRFFDSILTAKTIDIFHLVLPLYVFMSLC